MEVRAVTKYVGISPQKTRWVIDQVRGMQAERALAVLRYMSQSAAEPVAKTIASALAAVWRPRAVQADHPAFVAHYRGFGRTGRVSADC